MTNNCQICLDNKKNNELIYEICTTSDKHIFCDDCFNEWKIACKISYKNLTCPICRTFITKNIDINCIYKLKSIILPPENGLYINKMENAYNIIYNEMINDNTIMNSNYIFNIKKK